MKFQVSCSRIMDEDEFETVFAHDFEQAAEKYAEYYDSDGDYPLSKGKCVEITIKDSSGIVKKFSLSAYQTTIYNAEEI